MRVVGAQLYRYSLPLVEPLSLRGNDVCVRDGVLIGLQSEDGRVGWGDAAPLPAYTTESIADVEEQLPRVVGMLAREDLAADDGRASALLRVRLDAFAPSVACGVETALMGLSCGASPGAAHVLNLAGFDHAVRVNGLLAGTRERILRDVGTLVDQGYGTFKLKVGQRPLAADIDVARTVLGLLGNRCVLRLDANRAWSLREAVQFGHEVGADGIAYLEEPLRDPAELPAFFSTTGIPVALDESVCGLEPRDLEGRGDVGAVILKPTLLGGLSRARQWADKAMELNIMPVISSSFESGVGILGLARFASSLRCRDVAVGLDTYRWLERDVIRPRIRFARGAVHPSPGGGRVYELEFALLREIKDA